MCILRKIFVRINRMKARHSSTRVVFFFCKNRKIYQKNSQNGFGIYTLLVKFIVKAFFTIIFIV